MSRAVLIEAVSMETLDLVLPLIAEYQRFYRAVPDEERNQAFFARLIEDPTSCRQFLALDDGRNPLGFATLYFPNSSVSARTYCLMNDLYVRPQGRGRGIGRALIERCREYAADHGHSHLQWQTELDNTVAQALYDKVGATCTEWYEYTLPVGGAPS